jgi:hypothetical protein
VIDYCNLSQDGGHLIRSVPLALPVRNFLLASTPESTGKASGTLFNELLIGAEC